MKVCLKFEKIIPSGRSDTDLKKVRMADKNPGSRTISNVDRRNVFPVSCLVETATSPAWPRLATSYITSIYVRKIA